MNNESGDEMKRVAGLLLSMLIIITLASCGARGNNIMTSTSAGTIAATEVSTVTFTIPAPDVIHSSGDVFDYPFDRRYRYVYYEIDGIFSELLVDSDVFMQWVESRWNSRSPDEEPTEMFLAAFVKHFQVPRAEFEIALEKFVRSRMNRNSDLTEEFHEPPNPDIIYTFDNEIINAYYRRENPVVPDWSRFG